MPPSFVIALANFHVHSWPGWRARRALEKMIEEGELPQAAVRIVVVRPFLAAVDLQPLIGRGDEPESLERAARVQPVIAPTRNDVGGDANLVQVGGLGRPEIIEKRVLGGLGPQVLDQLVRSAPAN